MIGQDKKYQVLLFLLLIGLMYQPIFGHLSTLCIQLWDESRLAVNAYEMSKNHQFWVTYYDGQPDMWNTKPPLMIWLQVLFIQFLGYSELAIRMPSALATLATLWMVYRFSSRYFGRKIYGVFALLVLLTSTGYVTIHGTRTGDYDALLTFFTTLYVLSVFSFFQTNKRKYLILFFIGITLAVLTKSVSGFFFVPPLLIYVLVSKKRSSIFRKMPFYLGIIGTLFFIFGYYFLRESYNPGYIQAVFENELGGRFLHVPKELQTSFWMYVENLLGKSYGYWISFLMVGFIFAFYHKDEKIKQLGKFLLLLILVFILLISFSKTRFFWYDLPLYPLMSIVVSISIVYFYDFIQSFEFFQKTLTVNVFPVLFSLFLFWTPYQEILDKTYKPKDQWTEFEQNEIAYFLRSYQGKEPIFVSYFGYNAHFQWYVKLLKEKGVQVDFVDYKQLKAGQKVYVSQKMVRSYLRKNRRVKELELKPNLYYVTILE